jgi:hypothetical protein
MPAEIFEEQDWPRFPTLNWHQFGQRSDDFMPTTLKIKKAGLEGFYQDIFGARDLMTFATSK